MLISFLESYNVIFFTYVYSPIFIFTSLIKYQKSVNSKTYIHRIRNTLKNSFIINSPPYLVIIFTRFLNYKRIEFINPYGWFTYIKQFIFYG